MAKFLSEQDFQVSIDQRLIGHTIGECVLVVLWSGASIENFGVVDLARAAQKERKLVQITLDGMRRDDIEGPAPLNFRHWQYGQHHGPWRQLLERIDLIARGASAGGAPFTSLIAMAGASVAIFSIAVSHRVAVGEFTPQADAAAPQQLVTTSYNALAPAPAFGGGPEAAEPDLGLSDDFRFHRLRAPAAIRVNAVADLPNITSPRAMAQPQIARPGILRRMLNVAEDNIPFVRTSEETREVR
ncbi:MAG: hypothetical protein GC206_09650 [Alphaproteobacteria bacterium]|nr:hypothetical protein [Alphaproteobacteria bacterium]